MPPRLYRVARSFRRYFLLNFNTQVYLAFQVHIYTNKFIDKTFHYQSTPTDPVSDDGYITVSRTKSPRNGQTNTAPNPPSPNRLSPNHASRNRGNSSTRGRPSQFGSLPPNAAAADRSGQYASQSTSGYNHMRQSALPVIERDPLLLEVEQNKGRKVAREFYRPGMIIRAIHHEPYVERLSRADDKARTESIYGGIHSKYRKMIVIGLYKEHYIAIPLYTHNGNGLAGKAKPEEFVSVRDHRRPAGPFTALSIHKTLSTETLNAVVEPFDPKSAAHLTYPVSRKYDLPIIQEGHLTKSSTTRLIQLYLQYGPKDAQVGGSGR